MGIWQSKTDNDIFVGETYSQVPFHIAKENSMKELDKIAFVTVIFNFTGNSTRIKLYQEFKERLKEIGIEIITIECIFPGQSYEVTNCENQRDIQLFSENVSWVKENCLNVAIDKLGDQYKYFAWLDADLEFANKSLLLDTVIALQSHPIIQLFENGNELDEDGNVFKSSKSFCYYIANKISISKKNFKIYYPHPGFAWAARTETLRSIKFFDKSPIGTGDLHMAFAFVGNAKESIPADCGKVMEKEILKWGELAYKEVKGNLGYVPGNITHYWHGHKINRRNNERWNYLIKHNFDPNKHLSMTPSGIYKLVNCSGLEKDLIDFFVTRDSLEKIIIQ